MVVTAATLPGPLLVDGHVHFHACYPPGAFLDAARANFDAGARALGLAPGVGILLLTEGAGDHWFLRWRDAGVEVDRWAVRPGDDGMSLLAERDGAPRLVIIAGRQLVTREGLEVLATGCAAPLPDGLPFRDALEAAASAGAVRIIPWGFGKWWLARGRRVRDLVDTAPPGDLFLGDNGGRPHGWPEPALLVRGRRRGLFTLPGSDPLPFGWQADRVGSFGFVLDGGAQARRAGADLLIQLRRLRGQPARFGRPESPGRFVRAQVQMQWRKRIRGGAP